MRKVIAIIFVFILLFNLAGYYIFYQYRLHEVKMAMKDNLRRNKLNKNVVCFTFTEREAKNLDWEDDHEFSLNGEMYDVIEKYGEGNNLIIRCISDKMENKLLQQYRHDYEKEKPSSKSSTIALLKIVTNLFEPAVTISFAPVRVNKQVQFPFYSSRLNSLALSILTPPPQTV